MGAVKSKHRGEGTWVEQPGTITLAAEPPWLGPQIQYHLLEMNVAMSANFSWGSAGQHLTTSNIDTYYPVLRQPYDQGFELTSYYRIPGAQQQRGLFSTSVNVPFQGIFLRRLQANLPATRYELRVEKSVLVTQHMYTGLIRQQAEASNTSDMINKIAANSQAGARLVCVELTGGETHQGFRNAWQGVQPILGVDLFFHVPVAGPAPVYHVQCVNIPIPMTITPGFRQANVHYEINWTDVLGSWLNQGWRLVEIFLDQAQLTQMKGIGRQQKVVNSIWFFEKEQSRLQDPTPQYQGTVVPYTHTVTAGFGGTTRATGSWATLLEQMGQRGWELGCILETESVKAQGFASADMQLLFFFQRPIQYLNQAPPPGAYAPGPPQAGGYAPGPPQAGGYAPGPPQGGGYAPGPPQAGGYAPGPPQGGGYAPGPPGPLNPAPPPAGFAVPDSSAPPPASAPPPEK